MFSWHLVDVRRGASVLRDGDRTVRTVRSRRTLKQRIQPLPFGGAESGKDLVLRRREGTLRCGQAGRPRSVS